jgi:hypothetical protein
MRTFDCWNGFVVALSRTCRKDVRHRSAEMSLQFLRIRGGSSSGEKVVAGACNHPNWLVLPFRLELIRVAA